MLILVIVEERRRQTKTKKKTNNNNNNKKLGRVLFYFLPTFFSLLSRGSTCVYILNVYDSADNSSFQRILEMQ